MRLFAPIVLILIGFYLKHSQASVENWVISQRDLERLPVSQRADYLIHVFRVLGAQELNGGNYQHCVIAGDVFPKRDGVCRPRINNCADGAISCAPMFGVETCLTGDKKISRTEQCFEQTPDKNRLGKFLASVDSQPKWNFILRAINEFCGANKNSKDILCEKLKQESGNHLQIFERLGGKLGWLFGLLFNEAHAETFRPCTYDPKTQIFYGWGGNFVKAVFATHGVPQSVRAFWKETENGQNVSQATLKLLAAQDPNKVKKMLEIHLDVSRLLKMGSLKWIGIEGSNEPYMTPDRRAEKFGEMNDQANELKKAGISKKDQAKAMIIIYGAQTVAWYDWIKSQDRRTKFKFEATGIDNMRDPRTLELEHQWLEIYKKFQVAVAHPLDPTWRVLISEMEKVRAEQKNLDETVFHVRDRGMAEDIMTNLATHEFGYTLLGSDHQEGVIKHLTQLCLSQRRVQEASDSGAVREMSN